MHEYANPNDPHNSVCHTGTRLPEGYTCELDCAPGYGGDGSVDSKGLECEGFGASEKLDERYPTCTGACQMLCTHNCPLPD